MIIVSLIFAAIHISFFLFILFLLVAFVTGAPYLPTPHKVVEEMIALADVEKGNNIADLGSGDGRILIAVAKKGAHATGWEINPFLVFWSLIKSHVAGVSQYVTLHWGDYGRANISGFDTIFIYSIASHMERIEKKMRSELPKGAKVVSCTFAFPHWQAVKKTASKIYCYQV